MDAEEKLAFLEHRVEELTETCERIKERNRRVEADKAWEVSLERKLAVAGITYVAAALVIYLIGSKKFLFDALIPAGAYLLSVQTFPFFKTHFVKSWLAKQAD